MIKIGSIGYNYLHDADFVMDRPNGSGSYLFLLIKSSARFVINGCEHKVAKGSYVILSPTAPCLYKALTDIYCDDWLYFSVDEDDIDNLKKMGIKIDEPVYLGDTNELSHIVLNLTYEHYSKDALHDEIEQHYIQILFLKLSRLIMSRDITQSTALNDKKSSYINLRTMIYNEPEKIADISEMAELVGISRSSLQHNYKKMFGVSIMQDVIASRIERAKRRLIGTNSSIAEISQACGYKCEYSFMRQFKERTGYTPTEYRTVTAKGEFDFDKSGNE